MRIAIFLIATIACIISQLPIIYTTSLGDALKATWIIPFMISLFDFYSIRIKNIIGFILFLLIFFLFCLVSESVTNNQYLGSDVQYIAISCMVFVTSCITMNSKIGLRLLNTLPLFLLITGLIISVYIFSNYELVDSLSSKAYVYGAKNSMAPILTSIVVMAIFFYNPPHLKAIKIVAIVIITIVIILMRSRATILGLLFAVSYYIFTLDNKRLKLVFVLLLIVFVVAIITIPSLHVIIIDQIMFAGRDSSDINEISSKRVDRIPQVLQLFSNSPIIGVGNLYFDCMPVVVLAQYGIVGFSIIFVFLIALFKRLYKNRNRNSLHRTAFVLYCVFLINSLFEAKAPFGPGVKSLVLWMFVGFIYANPQLLTKQKKV